MNPDHRARLVAFHLPQFHPIPENDAWWGPGFTEWTNVAQCRPHFPGHDQPRFPTDLGYYDLRVPEVRQKQANLARAHGIEAFCYWHYWFHGQRPLHRPIDEMLLSGSPDFSFCLAWANETWSRRWLGEERDILIRQTYSEVDDVAHAKWLAPVLADKRCLRVHGRPVLLVYRPGDLPQPQRTVDTIRAACGDAGLLNPFLLGINAHSQVDFRKLGFDGNVDFEPQLGVLPGYDKEGLKVYDYASARELMKNHTRDHPLFPCICVGWDNTPRRGPNGIVFTNSNPELFAAGLSQKIDEVAQKPSDERLVFINAWNEWAEGNYLEPDLKWGRAYLEAVRRVNVKADPALSESRPDHPTQGQDDTLDKLRRSETMPKPTL